MGEKKKETFFFLVTYMDSSFIHIYIYIFVFIFIYQDSMLYIYVYPDFFINMIMTAVLSIKDLKWW